MSHNVVRVPVNTYAMLMTLRLFFSFLCIFFFKCVKDLSADGAVAESCVSFEQPNV